MQNKTVLITGGNAGIGLETARALAQQGATVVIVARDVIKGEQAVADIKQTTGNEKVSFMKCDLGSQKQIRQLAADFKAKHNRLDVLVNNAGAFFSEYGETEDGIERQFAINHLGPFLLTNLLLDWLKASAPARIVNVASRAHYRGRINFDDLYFRKNYDGFIKAYGQSKLANVLFTNELARKLEGTGVTVNSLHPGVVATDIALKESKGIYRFGWWLWKHFMITPAQGAETSIYLASSPAVDGVTGKYFDKSKAIPAAKQALDKNIAAQLWEVSEKLTGLA
ncbi:SDR family oxidoreductase [soil metagenome]